MYKLYSMQRSGNSYKVRLALALLNAPYRAIEVDILHGESRTPDFLAKNPSGKVPLLEVAEGTACLAIERRTWSGEAAITHVRFTYPGEAHELVARFSPLQR